MSSRIHELSSEQLVIAGSEALKYRHVWQNCKTYNDKHHDVDLWIRRKLDYPYMKGASFLVLGCGDGELVQRLAYCGHEAVGVDIFAHPNWKKTCNVPIQPVFKEAALWDQLPLTAGLNKFDMVICADVMEHIPPELLPNVLLNIDSVCDKALFQIANMNSKFEGYDLHPIKEDAVYTSSIMDDIRWLGFDWQDRLYYASDNRVRNRQWKIQHD